MLRSLRDSCSLCSALAPVAAALRSSKHACLELFLTRPGGLAHFKLYKQSCVTCSNEASPNFTERVVRDFVTRALFKARGLRHTGPPVVFRNKKPHARALCEACQTDPNQRFH